MTNITDALIYCDKLIEDRSDGNKCKKHTFLHNCPVIKFIINMSEEQIIQPNPWKYEYSNGSVGMVWFECPTKEINHWCTEEHTENGSAEEKGAVKKNNQNNSSWRH